MLAPAACSVAAPCDRVPATRQGKEPSKERRARIKQRIEQREFSLRNLLAGADGEGNSGVAEGGGRGEPLRVLIIGDGDFSFSCALVKALRTAYRCEGGARKRKKRRSSGNRAGNVGSSAAASAVAAALPPKTFVVATSYDSREQLLLKYPDSSFYHLRLLGADGKSHDSRRNKRKRRKNNKKRNARRGALAFLADAYADHSSLGRVSCSS